MMAEPVPQWAQTIITHLTELERLIFDVPVLRDNTITNCKELENIHKTICTIQKNTRLVPQILELLIENCTNFDDLSKKIIKLENSKINCPNCIQPPLNAVL